VAVGGVARPGGGGAAARAVGPGSGEGAQRSRGDDRRRRWQWWEGAGPARPGKGPAELRAGGGPAPPMLMMFFPPAHLMTIKLKIFQHFSFNNSSNFWPTFYKMLEHFSETFLINIFSEVFPTFFKNVPTFLRNVCFLTIFVNIFGQRFFSFFNFFQHFSGMLQHF
jgi:hypothetical protein